MARAISTQGDRQGPWKPGSVTILLLLLFFFNLGNIGLELLWIDESGKIHRTIKERSS